MTGNHLLLFSRDPGGANQMIAVLRMLQACRNDGTLPDDPAMRDFIDGLQVGRALPRPLAYTKGYARRHWAEEGLDSLDWPDIGPEAIPDWLKANCITAVITGTSDVDDDTDQQLWRAAKKAGIPSHAFLDHASAAAARFTAPDGGLVHPERIYLHEETTRETLRTLGIGDGHLVMSRNLFLDTLSPGHDTTALRRDIRRQWKLAEDAPVILFASEPVAEATAMGRVALYDEFESIGRVVAAIAGGEALPGLECGIRQPVLVIRPHPRDRQGKYDALAESAPVAVLVSDAGLARDAIQAADLVVGMDSSLLVEAQQLGVPALSLIAESSFAQLRGGACDPELGMMR